MVMEENLESPGTYKDSPDKLPSPKNSASPNMMPKPSLDEVFTRGRYPRDLGNNDDIPFEELTRSRALEIESERITEILDAIEMRSSGFKDHRLLSCMLTSLDARDTYLDSYSYSARALQASQVPSLLCMTISF